MTDILCRWLNEELRLSQIVEPKTFAQAFSSGYLFGEILHKYQLQNDFHMFMKKERSISRLNNFTRLEPTLHLLGISFNATTVHELMQEKQGVAAHIVYQLYISLERKKKADISGTVMKMMQPAATTSLRKKEHDFYCDRLHKLVKRDAQVNLEKISKHYQDKFQQVRSVVPNVEQRKKPLPVHDEKSKRIADRVSRQKLNDLMPCDQTTVDRAQKSPSHPSQRNLRKQQQQQQQQQRKEQQAQDVQNEIAQFETNKTGATSTLSHPALFGALPLDDSCRLTEVHGVKSKPGLQSNSLYIQQIRQRLDEDAMAREQRETRVDRFLVEQFKARQAEQDAQHEEYLVKRWTRQTKQEQRLVVQLLQIRKQKEVILNNRLFREEQIQQRREKDFQEALQSEAVR